MDSSKRCDIGVNMHLVKLPSSSTRHLDESTFNKNEQKAFHPKKLGNDQEDIFRYVVDNPDEIVCIQAVAGCGKSFSLKTIANNSKLPVDVIIYKNNLLDRFRYCAHTYTVAKFMMQTLHLSYDDYKTFDSLISSDLTPMQFMLVVVSMLRRFRLPDYRGSLVILDEYTMVPKPFLLVLLMMLKHHGVGAVICGDKNSLQNIRNSMDTDCSWYDIVNMFATRQFNLTVNKRCDNAIYNDIVEYLAGYSSERSLDDWAYGILAAVFPQSILGNPEYNHVHLAPTHQELTAAVYDLVCEDSIKNKIRKEFYSIEQTRIDEDEEVVDKRLECVREYMECIERGDRPKIGNFLPYLPLVVGARYYVNERSEYTQGVLVSINAEDGSIDVRLDNGNTVNLKKTEGRHAMPIEHVDFILHFRTGKIYCYPIYPANFMTIHNAQGCTITGDVDLMLAGSWVTYQMMYVALSRVRSPDQIVRIDIPDKIDHLVSAIIHFPELASNIAITRDILSKRMTDYKRYKVADVDLSKFSDLCVKFLSTNDENLKNSLRQEIIAAAKQCPRVTLTLPPIGEHLGRNYHIPTAKIFKYKEVFLALACIDDLDRNVWLHEFVLSNPDMADEGPSSPLSLSQRVPSYLLKFAGIDSGLDEGQSSTDYIRRHAETKTRLPEEAESWKPYRLEELSTNSYLETSSQFCCKVYQMYKSSTAITVKWLVNELNIMLEENPSASSKFDIKMEIDQ